MNDDVVLRVLERWAKWQIMDNTTATEETAAQLAQTIIHETIARLWPQIGG